MDDLRSILKHAKICNGGSYDALELQILFARLSDESVANNGSVF